jgi:hypothetical protein
MLGAMAARSRRPRTERRKAARQLTGEVRAREKLAAAGPGGAADRPITVVSASLVEPRARETPCVQCAGTLDLVRHQGSAGAPDLREVNLICRLCHTPRTIWFRIEARLPS